jgi:hypothetical protein
MLLSESASRAAECARSLDAFVESISVAPPATVPATGPTSPAGTWASSSGDANISLYKHSTGSAKRQYELRPDGTYRYHAEHWGGSYRSDEWILVDERGKWKLDGDQLTIDPSSAERVVRGRKEIRKREKLPLEKVTYRWRIHFFEGIQETDLILTPPAKTSRDGSFAANSQFPGSYFFSASYRPEWVFPP